MKPDEISRVISRTIDHARKGGAPHHKQDELAMRAVLQLDPEMTEEAAMTAVRRFREREHEESQHRSP
jgi:hypothetical protein